MKYLINKIKAWWNHPCFNGHDDKIIMYEQSNCLVKCNRCGRTKAMI